MHDVPCIYSKRETDYKESDAQGDVIISYKIIQSSTSNDKNNDPTQNYTMLGFNRKIASDFSLQAMPNTLELRIRETRK